MTELETMQRAKLYMDKLAQGIDPTTDRELLEDSALNNLRLARCFFYVSDVLGRVIANGGNVGTKLKQLPFAVTAQQLASVPLSQTPLRISQLVDLINSSVGNPEMRRLGTTRVTDWLLDKGFLEKQDGPDGKSHRLPTEAGLRMGLSVEIRHNQYGEYQAVLYNADAQQFVLDNLPDILAAE